MTDASCFEYPNPNPNGSASGKKNSCWVGNFWEKEVGLADTSDLASNDVNGIQMEILRLMPMGRNEDRDAKC